eukprot:6411711-Pyramimonas_sp.AAC.1
MAALRLLADARREQQCIEPVTLAAAVRDIAKLPDNPFGDEPVLPRQTQAALLPGSAGFRVACCVQVTSRPSRGQSPLAGTQKSL